VESAVELRNITIERDGFTILKDVTSLFPQGRSTVVMGFSGSGKSTLLKIAAGLTPQDEGTVKIFGKDLDSIGAAEMFEVRGRAAYVFQDAALWANMTTYQNLALPLQFHRRAMSPGQIQARIQGLIDEFDFRDNLQLRPASLSAGERKILSFIRALVLDPEVLFLDEPTSFVDSATSDRMIHLLKRLKQEGKTLITATHSPTIAAQLADRLVVLKDGEILAQGDLKDVSRSTDPRVTEILSDVLSQPASYDADLLDLLGGNGEGKE